MCNIPLQVHLKRITSHPIRELTHLSAQEMKGVSLSISCKALQRIAQCMERYTFLPNGYCTWMQNTKETSCFSNMPCGPVCNIAGVQENNSISFKVCLTLRTANRFDTQSFQYAKREASRDSSINGEQQPWKHSFKVGSLWYRA